MSIGQMIGPYMALLSLLFLMLMTDVAFTMALRCDRQVQVNEHVAFLKC